MVPTERSLEIRKLSMYHIEQLGRILDLNDSWKKLMEIIPKTLSKEVYQCDINRNNLPKYRTEHFNLIINAAEKERRSPTVILLDEWGTSGRIRPAVGHLQYLLEKSELFRAADYVAEVILNSEKPARPAKGPSANVTITPDEDPDKNIEKILDEINYPSSAIENINKMSSVNSNINHSKELKIPEIVITELEDNKGIADMFKVPIVVPKSKETPEIIFTNSSIISDTTDSNPAESNPKSESKIYNNVPNLDLINSIKEQSANIDSAGERNMPVLSSLLSNSGNIPNLSELIQDNQGNSEESANIPNISALQLSSDGEKSVNIPNISALQLNSDSSANVPDISALISSSNNSASSMQNANSPDLSGLLAQNSLSQSESLPEIKSSNTPDISGLLGHSSDTSKISRTASSPLPFLTLNTNLPHLTYAELERATDNFNPKPLSEGGRFLGEGAFGKVYLAVDILGKSVAVKQLLLENNQKVEVEDYVTVQFKTEVEILSQYKHENLISLLGYSCDGDTYCLLYEYIPGGSLKDRLQDKQNKLFPTDRLYIAHSTAKSIAYLHTAFDKPLIHRDIKSANILLDYYNKPKLCDFGLVKLAPTANTIQTSLIHGTNAYMSPEAQRGDISVKLDTYSFGVVLLELLTSLPPIDENRSGVDLVTHIEETCDDDIGALMELLDTSVGPWIIGNVNVAEKMFELALLCLKPKKSRPTMVEVATILMNLIKEWSGTN